MIAAAEFVCPEDRPNADRIDSPEPTATLQLSGGPNAELGRRCSTQLQHAPAGTTLQLTVERGDEKLTKKLTPVAADGLFVADRGFLFKPIERIRRATSLSEQVQYGWDETTDALGMVFRFLKKIGTQVPVTALGGPITIAKAAGYSAYDGLPALLIFLTMLSANLAVLNFLPIPLLDGGHMAFLAYEGVRGRPASEKFVVALHTVGFVFIVTHRLRAARAPDHLAAPRGQDDHPPEDRPGDHAQPPGRLPPRAARRRAPRRGDRDAAGGRGRGRRVDERPPAESHVAPDGDRPQEGEAPRRDGPRRRRS